MRVFTNLLFKVTVSSMVLTAPAMINGHANTGGVLLNKEVEMPFASATVIKNFVDHLTIWPVRAYVDPKSIAAAFTYMTRKARPSGNSSAFPRKITSDPYSSGRKHC
jgi:hypothetical protein